MSTQYEFVDFEDESGVRDTPLLLSARSQKLVLSAMRSMEFRHNWRNIIDDANWDDIEGAIHNAEYEIMELKAMDATPVGAIMAFAHPVAPTGWLHCSGQAVNKADYPELYDRIGDSYTEVPDTLTFDLPDLRHLFLRGANSEEEIATIVGSDTHTLSIAEMPAHTHTLENHQHGYNTSNAAGTNGATLARGTGTVAGFMLSSLVQSPTGANSTGGGGSHNNIPAAMTIAWMIKVLP